VCWSVLECVGVLQYEVVSWPVISGGDFASASTACVGVCWGVLQCVAVCCNFFNAL